jgi:hypothetical protein
VRCAVLAVATAGSAAVFAPLVLALAAVLIVALGLCALNQRRTTQ